MIAALVIKSKLGGLNLMWPLWPVKNRVTILRCLHGTVGMATMTVRQMPLQVVSQYSRCSHDPKPKYDRSCSVCPLLNEVTE